MRFLPTALSLFVLSGSLSAADTVAQWKLDETTGTTATDSTGTQHGIYKNGVGLGHGGVNAAMKAALFDGQDDHVAISQNDAFLLENGTVSLWFNDDDLSGRQGLFSRDSKHYDGGGHLTMYLQGNDLNVRLQSDSHSYRLRTDVSADTWHHVAFSFGSAGMKLFLDGAMVDQDLGYMGGLVGNHEPIAIGANTWHSGDGNLMGLRDYYSGKMGDVRIFDDQMNWNQINQLQASAVAIPEPSTYLIMGSLLLVVGYARRKQRFA